MLSPGPQMDGALCWAVRSEERPQHRRKDKEDQRSQTFAVLQGQE